MTTTNCPKCGNEVSDNSRVCPSCGRRLSGAKASVGAAAAAGAAVWFFFVLGNGWHSEHSQPDRAPNSGRPNSIQLRSGKVVQYDEHGRKVFDGNKGQFQTHFNRSGRSISFDPPSESPTIVTGYSSGITTPDGTITIRGHRRATFETNRDGTIVITTGPPDQVIFSTSKNE